MQVCSICLQSLTLSSGVVSTPCNHKFHGVCMTRLIAIHERNERSCLDPPACPLCRHPIPRRVSEFSPVNSGLPEGDGKQPYFDEQSAERGTGGCPRQNPTDISGRIRSSRRAQNFERRVRDIIRPNSSRSTVQETASVNRGLDVFFYTNFVDFRLGFDSHIAEIEERTAGYERILRSRRPVGVFSSELGRQLRDLRFDCDMLARHYREVSAIVIRPRRLMDTEWRVVRAWNRAWPEQERLQFENKLRCLRLRVASLPNLRASVRA